MKWRLTPQSTGLTLAIGSVSRVGWPSDRPLSQQVEVISGQASGHSAKVHRSRNWQQSVHKNTILRTNPAQSQNLRYFSSQELSFYWFLLLCVCVCVCVWACVHALVLLNDDLIKWMFTSCENTQSLNSLWRWLVCLEQTSSGTKALQLLQRDKQHLGSEIKLVLTETVMVCFCVCLCMCLCMCLCVDGSCMLNDESSLASYFLPSEGH